MPRLLSDGELEKSIVKILDEVIETGKPVEVERGGKRLIIAPSESQSKLQRLEEHPGFLVGDPDDIVHMDWSDQWRPNL